MILAIDVYYIEDRAKAVGVLFDAWESDKENEIIHCYLGSVAPYQSGEFYRRELPCIVELLKQVDLNAIQTIIIDGYVYLSEGKKGLGAYLDEYLNHTIPIVGVAKNAFDGSEHVSQAVFRGISKHPLYISSSKNDLMEVALNIQKMSGEHRFPTLLKLLDDKTKLFKNEIAN